MRPLLIDTNAYSAFKMGDNSIKDIISNASSLIISPIVLGELISGYDQGSKSKNNKLELQQFLDSPRVKILPITSDTAHFFSQVLITLKRKGRPIPTNDIWIAAQALEHGCVVCTFDKHFYEIDGLLVVNNLADLMVE